MRVVRLHAPFDFRMHDEPIPEIAPDEVLVKIKSVGVCASDLHYYQEGGIGANVVREPLIVGHEPSGVIESVGSAVTGLKPGDRVAIEPAKPCWTCDLCKAGHTNVCKDVQFFGTPPVDGALREFVAWPARLMEKIPDNISFDEAAMIEPLAVGAYSAKIAELIGGESIAVLGAGAIGLSVLQVARLASPSAITVTEPMADRRAAAIRLGADNAIDASEDDIVEQAIAANSGKEFDVVFECTGDPNAFRQAVELARPLARVVIVGIPTEDQYCFPAGTSRRKDLTIRVQRRSCGVAEDSIRMVAQGLVDVASYATHTFPLEKTKEAFDLACSKTDGVIRATIHVG